MTEPYDRSHGLTVIGEAAITSPADVATLTIVVQSVAAGAAHALRENTAKMQRVCQALLMLQVSQGDLQATGPTLVAVRRHGGKAEPPAAGPAYQPAFGASFGGGAEPGQSAGVLVSGAIKVSVGDVNRLGEILDAASSAGVGVAVNVATRLRDEAGARRNAVEAAGKDARFKASALAAVLGRQLGDAVASSEDIVSTLIWGSPDASQASAPGGSGLGSPAYLLPAPGEVLALARVRVTFALI